MLSVLSVLDIVETFVKAFEVSAGAAAISRCLTPAEFGHTLELCFWKGCPKIDLLSNPGPKRCSVVFRTHKYHQTARNFETNPMGPVPGSETQISRQIEVDFFN